MICQDGPLYVYNKDRTIVGFVKARDFEEIHRKLVRRTMEDGCDGLKAFYCATFDRQIAKEKIVIKINAARVLPVEAW